MPRKRHVSRNEKDGSRLTGALVMPRKRHVSRNEVMTEELQETYCHASQEACE